MSTTYELKRSARARALRVAVYAGGEVRVTVPSKTTQDAIDRFLQRYAAWIRSAVQKESSRKVIYAKKTDIAQYKARAKAFAEERCAHYARLYGVSYRAITIRAQKSQWGSCSRQGNLSFNYKIALLPPKLAEYVIVHEICHLRAFDHSRTFWAQVERVIPDHLRRRRELRGLAFRFTEA